MIFRNKQEFRKYIIEKRDELDKDVRSQRNAKIITNLTDSKYYRCAQTIFVFVSFGSEVDTHGFIEQSLKDGKTVGVPKIITKERGIEVFKITGLGDLKSGYYGILEPTEGCQPIASDDIDLIIMPGVAFDRHGGRIGYGAGYYDRYLADMTKSVRKIALGYSFQVLDYVPTEDFDIRIDGIITDEEVIETK